MTVAQTPGREAPSAPIIQLRGAGFRNKGAELMLRTVAAELRRRFPGCTIALNYHIGSVEQRRDLGARDVVWMETHAVDALRLTHNALATLARRRTPAPVPVTDPPPRRTWRPARVAASVLRARAARSTDTVGPAQVDAVLDLSGFAYGDQWGPSRALNASRYHALIRQTGGAVVVLPQQLGPFEDPLVREAFRAMSAHADLIHARDRLSFEAARPVVADARILRQAPDFTIAPGGEAPPALAGRACVVPNGKMITHTDRMVAGAYPDFLRRCVELLRAKGTRPFVLVHDSTGDDLALAEAVADGVLGLEVVVEPDPFGIKAIIGGSLLTVGSRFHGLVNALSQSVPSLATGWSHKYEMLLEEYGCPECIIDVTIPTEELDRAIDRLITEPDRRRMIAALQRGEEERRRKVEQMWDEVAATIQAAWERRRA